MLISGCKKRVKFPENSSINSRWPKLRSPGSRTPDNSKIYCPILGSCCCNVCPVRAVLAMILLICGVNVALAQQKTETLTGEKMCLANSIPHGRDKRN